MKVSYAHLCDDASLSPQHKLSITGIFNQIVAPQIPVKHLKAFLAFEVELDYTEVGNTFDVRVECVDADGNKVISGKLTMTVSGKGQPWAQSPYSPRSAASPDDLCETGSP